MNTSSIHPGESISIWMSGRDLIPHNRLVENIKTEVCIVGGGIGGLTTAYLLAKEGKKVCVLESYQLGSGQSGKTTAQFSYCLDEKYFEIEKKHGQLGAYLAASSHKAALDLVEQIVQIEKIQCDFEKVNGYLFNTNEKLPELLLREIQAIHRAGLLRVEQLPCVPWKGAISGPCLLFPDQIQLHPLKYLKGLADYILNNGGKIFTQSHVQEISGSEHPIAKTKEGYTVSAQALVVATNAPINDLFAIHIKQAAYRSYVVALKMPPGAVSKGFYWDTDDPYHYVRLAGDDVLLVGGEDHKTGQNDSPADCYRRLEVWARNRFPFCREIVSTWSGQVMKTLDGLAYLGHSPIDGKNTYVITGDCGNGTTHCTLGAMIITDQIMGRGNPWESLYDPSRINLKVTGAFVKGNVNVAAQYANWVSGKIMELDKLPREEGGIVKKGIERFAAYKDDTGRVKLMSPVCTHLGCIVSWNSVEKSWDCPCHGSRFDCEGRVMEGPARSDLKVIRYLGNDETDFGMIKIDQENIIKSEPEETPAI